MTKRKRCKCHPCDQSLAVALNGVIVCMRCKRSTGDSLRKRRLAAMAALVLR
jgi:hypothetical protein